MRFTLIALILIAAGAQAAEKAEPYLKRSRVLFDGAASIYRKAVATNRVSERHRLLGRARLDVQKARELARKAQRHADARNREAVAAFVLRVRELADGIEVARAQFRATTDIVVQRTSKYRPTSAIKLQAAELERNTTARRTAAATRANIVRMTERARLQKWRLARIAERQKNARK